MSSNSLWISMTNIYQYIKSHLGYKTSFIFDEPCILERDGSSDIIVYETIILNPLDIVLRESEMTSRQEIFEFLMKNREYKTIRFIITKYYSTYLLCHFVFDILDILSNELFHLQTKIILYFEPQKITIDSKQMGGQKKYFIEEFKEYIKNNIPFIRKSKILPVYIKFIETSSYHLSCVDSSLRTPMESNVIRLEYNVYFEQRFHILFLKESEDDFSIQRLHFSIDL